MDNSFPIPETIRPLLHGQTGVTWGYYCDNDELSIRLVKDGCMTNPFYFRTWFAKERLEEEKCRALEKAVPLFYEDILSVQMPELIQQITGCSAAQFIQGVRQIEKDWPTIWQRIDWQKMVARELDLHLLAQRLQSLEGTPII